MAAKVRIELDSAGIQELMNDPGVSAFGGKLANRIVANAGEHFEVKGPLSPGSRSLYLIVPADYEGAVLEADEKRLSKAVSQCR